MAVIAVRPVVAEVTPGEEYDAAQRAIQSIYDEWGPAAMSRVLLVLRPDVWKALGPPGHTLLTEFGPIRVKFLKTQRSAIHARLEK